MHARVLRCLIIMTCSLAVSVEASAQHYAAIAYSSSTAEWGTANGYDNYDVAVRWAMAECNHSDCELAGWVADGCVALAAVTDDGGTWGTGYANGLSFEDAYTPAQIAALQSCDEVADDRRCEVFETVCSFE